MNITPPATFRSGFGSAAASRGRDPLARTMAWLGGFFATGAALAVGAFLAVFAAAAVALIAVTAGVLVFLTGLAFRARRVVYARSPVIEARKVGHAWVTYGWDRSAP